MLFLRATVPAWVPGDVRRTLDLHLPQGVLRVTIADVVMPFLVRLVEAPDLPARLAVSWDKVVFDATFKAGSWQIVGGTGAYERLTGGGTPGTTAASWGNVCTGEVRIAHAGQVHQEA